MNMKPSVILFTTISFVMILTVLIMKMVHTNEEILIENDKEYTDANALLVIHDLKNAIGKKLLENRSSIDDFLVSAGNSSIQYNNIKVVIEIEKFYQPYNLNNILQNKNMDNIKKFFKKNELDFEEFGSFIQKYFSTYNISKISLENNKQVQKILLAFQNYIQVKNIDLLLHNFTYFDMEQNDKYYRCNLIVHIDQYKYKSSFLYNLSTLDKNNIKVRDFEITIAS